MGIFRKVESFHPLKRQYKIQTDGVRFRICEKKRILKRNIFGEVSLNEGWFVYKEYDHHFGREPYYAGSYKTAQDKIERIKEEDIKELGDWRDVDEGK